MGGMAVETRGTNALWFDNVFEEHSLTEYDKAVAPNIAVFCSQTRLLT